jgi:hypothetical protein
MKNHLVVMLIQWYRIAATLFALMWKLHKMLGKIVLLEMKLNSEIKAKVYPSSHNCGKHDVNSSFSL